MLLRSCCSSCRSEFVRCRSSSSEMRFVRPRVSHRVASCHIACPTHRHARDPSAAVWRLRERGPEEDCRRRDGEAASAVRRLVSCFCSVTFATFDGLVSASRQHDAEDCSSIIGVFCIARADADGDADAGAALDPSIRSKAPPYRIKLHARVTPAARR